MDHLALIYNTNGHIFVYNNIMYFHCKYCNAVLADKKEPACITDEEKMIKDLVE